jgi:hypothetical protein
MASVAYDMARGANHMALDPQEAAKHVFIAYRQLDAIVKNDIGFVTAKTQLQTYNHILETLKQCFAIDKAFADAVKHFQPCRAGDENLAFQMESDGRTLLATAHSFIELYLSPEDKGKAIGFHA